MKGKLGLLPFLVLTERPGDRPINSWVVGLPQVGHSGCENRHTIWVSNSHPEVTESKQDPTLDFRLMVPHFIFKGNYFLGKSLNIILCHYHFKG